MLTFILNDGHEINWYVRTTVPPIWQRENNPPPYQHPLRFVTDCIADGHELEYLLRKFNNGEGKALPLAHKIVPSDDSSNVVGRDRGMAPVQHWSEDFAKFIYNNLE